MSTSGQQTDSTKFVSPGTGDAIEIVGFEEADEIAHMIEWLCRDLPAREFVPLDVENELRRQKPGSKLISLSCVEKLDVLTKLQTAPGASTAVVKEFAITFKLQIVAVDPSGGSWKLLVEQTYHVLNDLEMLEPPKLGAAFTVLSAEPVTL